MSKDDLGDRMKSWEASQSKAKFTEESWPVYARLDGRAFHTFTRGMAKPFDLTLTETMIDVAAYLLEHSHATGAYVQSDEISLAWEPGRFFFDGKIQKTVSVLASLAAAKFASVMPNEWKRYLPHFDCRICQMSTKTEVANMFLWRWLDARKNGVSAIARAHFSAKQLHEKNSAEMLAMLAEKGIQYDSFFMSNRYGTFLKVQNELRELTSEELAKIPKEHWPTEPVWRSVTKRFWVDDFVKMEDREGFIFD